MMKLRARLLSYTAAIAISASVAFAAVDGNAIADAYLAAGYDFVEVKVGPTQTKIEAIKGDIKIEVIIDNETGDPIKTEEEAADEDEIGRTGKEVKSVDKDFLDDDEDEEDEDDDEEDDDDDDSDEDDDDDSDDDDSDDDDSGDDDSDNDSDGDDGGDNSGSGGDDGDDD